jgi:cytochrome c-550 PedF
MTSCLIAGHTAQAEGYVRPTAIDTSSLKQLGDELHDYNPYQPDEEMLRVGAKAYLYNCSGCHGLNAVSGGVAPDLRLLSDSEADDEWFIARVRGGYTQNGVNKMPAYEGTLSQEGMWAIRTYILTLPKDE